MRKSLPYVLLVFVSLFMASAPFGKAAPTAGENSGSFTVILEHHYLDGETREEFISHRGRDLSEIIKKYRGWILVDLGIGHIRLKKYVDDISPLLKANGFFGVTDEGILSTFDGEPTDGNVIQSFFQIDLGKLESGTQQKLRKGIPVRSKDEFLEVLKAFQPYQVTANME